MDSIVKALGPVFSNPRTTLAGLLAVVVGAVAMHVVPAAVEFLGGQAGVGWQLVGLVLGFLPGALMKDKKVEEVKS